MSPIVIGAIVAGVLILGALAWFFLTPGHNHDCTEKRYLEDRNNPARKWFHGALALYRGDAGDPGYWDKACAVRQLSFWSCKEPKDVMELIELYHQGETTPAFDKLRLIWLARVAEGAGWLTAEQSWQWCEQAKVALLNTYPDWESIAVDATKGRAEWYDGEIPEEQVASNRENLAFAQQEILPLVPYR